jgi:alpha-tubulin suppressor-like RCC1 family protein
MPFVLVAALSGIVLNPTVAAAASGPDAHAVALASLHTCVLTTSGGVQCWGNNDSGELGNGTNESRSVPVDVSGLGSGVTAIDTGGAGHSCAVNPAGGVECWGRNRWGQLGDGTQDNSNVPVDVVGLGSGVVDVSTGGDNSCALTVAGAMKCWGRNETGQLGNGTTDASSVPVGVTGLGSGVAAISAGGNHTCALMDDGGLKCWGSNGFGQVGDGSTTHRYTPVDVSGLDSGVAAVSNGGAANACALMDDGGVKCWGSNQFGQVGDGTKTTRLTPVDVQNLSNATGVAAGGGGHVCAVTAGGAVKCWGRNDFGQLGDDTTSPSTTPVGVSGLDSGAAQVGTGGRHSCAVMDDGTVECWGRNDFAELGDGSLVNRHTPVAVGDATPPHTIVTTTPATPDAQGSYGATVNLMAAGDDFGGSGTTETRCELDPSSAPNSFSDLTDPCPVAGIDVSTPGNHVLYTASRDAEDNTETPAAFPFRVGHRLTVKIKDTGLGGSSVSSSPAGIDCPSTCTAQYGDTNVTLTASPGLGSAFAGWSGGGCSGTGTCTVSMTGDRTVTANFDSFLGVPPTTTITPDPPNPNGPGGSYAGSVHLTVDATDDSGVAETRCELDPSSPPASFDDLPSGCNYLGTGADVSSVGDHVLYAASVDTQGNKEDPVSFAFEIVKVPSPPTSVAVVASNTKATITWQPPSQDGGRPVTGYTVTASPGAITQSVDAATRSVKFTKLTNCTLYTFTVRATNVVGNGATASASAIPSSVVVRDSGYSRKQISITLGQKVTWCFDPANTTSHSVTSNGGLFDSGPKPAGASFAVAFPAAGRYPFHSAAPDTMTGAVSVKMEATPSGTSALLTWASAPPGPGSSMDVQVKPPGTTKWLDWRIATTTTSGMFSPSDQLFTVAGTYSFRARFRSSSGLSSWSSPVPCHVG